MFTPEQITTAIAVNAVVDPKSVFGQFLQLVTQLTVNPEDLMVEEQDFAAQMEKMLRKAIMADGVVTQSEQSVLDFFNKLKEDSAMQESMGNDVSSLLSGIKK